MAFQAVQSAVGSDSELCMGRLFAEEELTQKLGYDADP